MEEKIILIFSGHNPRAIIAFLRTLEYAHIRNYAIVALTEEDYVLKTKYADKVVYTRVSSDLHLDVFRNIITSIRKKEERFFLIPSSEYFNRFLLSERENIENLGCEVPLISKNIYELILNKESFNLLCTQHRICVPPKLSFPEEYTMPFVAKPKNYFASDGNIYSPFLVNNERDYGKLKNDFPLDSFFMKNLSMERVSICFIILIKREMYTPFLKKILHSNLMANQLLRHEQLTSTKGISAENLRYHFES